jgi:methionine aminotransferase
MVEDTNIIILSDEVYEHIIFDGITHQGVLRRKDLKERSVVIYSFGKTFHATGWKIGYIVAPDWITTEIRKVHQFVVFTVSTPMQIGLAKFAGNPDNYKYLPAFYQEKRDIFQGLVKDSRFEIIPCYGTFFQLLSYKNISDLGDMEMAEKLTKEHGVASIPISVFYEDGKDDKILRFCFAKNEDTLEKAAEILCKI